MREKVERKKREIEKKEKKEEREKERKKQDETLCGGTATLPDGILPYGSFSASFSCRNASLL